MSEIENSPATKEEVARLRKRVAQLEDIVEELQSAAGGESSSPSDVGFADDRDRAVLDALEPGDVVTPPKLGALYRKHTDVRNKQTTRSRVESLTASPKFERLKQGTVPAKFRFVGGEPE